MNAVFREKCSMSVFILVFFVGFSFTFGVGTWWCKIARSKFLIDYSNVTVIPDVAKKARAETREEFQELVDKFSDKITPADLIANKEKTNRNLRITEALRDHSKEAEMVIM